MKPGDTVGRLTLVAPAIVNNRRGWRVRCACGAEKLVREMNLTRSDGNRTRSCGCHRREVSAKRATHGQSPRGAWTREYAAWTSMKNRVKPTSRDRAIYFDRGIGVCAEWAGSFEQFFRDMGPRPGPDYSLDRIDNDRGYEPGNCRWTTRSAQARNRRNDNLRHRWSRP